VDWSAKDTIAAIATATGRGGVAIVRLSGSQALEIGRRLFKPSAAATNFESHRLYYGHFIHPQTGSHLDSGLFAYMKGPHSYTGEDVVELHGHGGTQNPRQLLEAAIVAGMGNIRVADPGEFTFRAFLNQRLSLVQAEAVEELVASQNQLAQKLAIKRLDGDWRREVSEVQEKLTQLLTHFEADLDFPDEILGTAELADRLNQLQSLRLVLERWLQAAAWQRFATEPFTLCIAGPSNVGKSTLFNTLLRQERAIVDDSPGTTRDYLDATLQIEGLPVRLVDTAGLRATTPLSTESEGIERSKIWMRRADLLLWVDDSTTVLEVQSEREAFKNLLTAEQFLHLINKKDLLDQRAIAIMEKEFPQAYFMAAKLGDGFDGLIERIVSRGRERILNVEQISFSLNERQYGVIRKAHEHLILALKMLETNDGGYELLTEELWSVGRSLEEFTGKALAPDVIESIFKNFCIGK
jgi:tRNA modification GTPase